jgi:hypothetical protein
MCRPTHNSLSLFLFFSFSLSLFLSFVLSSTEYTGKIFAEEQDGIATEELIEAYWGEGWTWQVLHLQQFHDTIYRLLASLEDHFACTVGSNAYMTPAHSQGLAPTYEELELFNVQMQGVSKWKLHQPVVELAREGGPEYTPEQLQEKTKALMEVTLHAGRARTCVLSVLLQHFPSDYVSSRFSLQVISCTSHEARSIR